MRDFKVIEFLKWDSDFFGMKVGKIQLSRGSFEKSKFIDEQNKEQFDLIYGFSNTNQNPNRFWESLGFYFVDCTITLSMKFYPEKYKELNYVCCSNLSDDDIRDCYNISETIAPVSRFYRESVIGKELTKKMYRKWVDTALDGSFSDFLFVERVNDGIGGIHTIRTENNIGVFTLTGVRAGFQGCGIGRKLWNQSFAYWALSAHKVESVVSKFSISNIPSLSFHIAMGFNRSEEINYIYHYVKKDR